MTGDLPDETKARKDVLLGLFNDFRAHSRHVELLRSNVVNLMIVVASVLLAVIGNDGRLDGQDLPLCLALVVVGIVGLGFAASYTELRERNRIRAMRLRAALETEFFTPQNNITSLLTEVDEPHEAGRLYRWSRRLTGSTQLFWLVVPSLILAAGVVLTVIAL